MPAFSSYIEASLGTIFSFSKAHDAGLISRVAPELTSRKPSVTITSTELGPTSPGQFTAGKHELLGENQFPHLSWTATDAAVQSWLLVCEDADAPLPTPIVHGIYYDIPAGKTSVGAEDFSEVGGKAGELAGGFRYGMNRRGTIWVGPRPVISHGNHRYFFTVIGLRIKKVELERKKVTGEELKKSDGILKGNVVCWGEYVGNFERKLADQS